MKIIAMIATAVAISAAQAAAQDLSSAPAEHVNYADLDLGSPAGKLTLEQRIRAAASRVCNIGSGKQILQENRAGRACYRTSLADGIRQMDRLIAARQSGTSMAAATLIVSVR
jgi:UrcA family protein